MMYDSEFNIKRNLEWANKKLRNTLCSPNFWFDFNRVKRQFEFWEKRGPITQMVFPLDFAGEPLERITEWELRHAVYFVHGVRTPEKEENYYKHKEYKQ